MIDNEFPAQLALDPRVRKPIIGRPRSSAGVTGPSQPGLLTAASLSTTAISADTIYYHPLWFPDPTEIDALFFEVTSGAAGNARCGLYQGDTDWQPAEGSAPLVDSGDIDVTSNAVKSFTHAPIVVQGLLLFTLHSAVGITVRNSVTTLLGGMVGGAAGTIGSSPYLRTMRVATTYRALSAPGIRWSASDVTAAGISSFGFVRVSNPDPPGW